METLDEIGLKYGTDKASTHHDYLKIYEQLIDWRAPIWLLEIGWYEGASMRMWSDWFTHPDARIVGVDIEPKDEIPGVEFFRCDATSPEIAAWADDGPLFDVIIDDGSHLSPAVIRTFELLWPYVASGGLYIVEDLHVSYRPEWQGHDAATSPGPWGETSMQYLKHLADEVHRDHCGAGPTYGPWPRPEVAVGGVESVAFYPGLCVIRKK